MNSQWAAMPEQGAGGRNCMFSTTLKDKVRVVWMCLKWERLEVVWSGLGWLWIVWSTLAWVELDLSCFLRSVLNWNVLSSGLLISNSHQFTPSAITYQNHHVQKCKSHFWLGNTNRPVDLGKTRGNAYQYNQSIYNIPKPHTNRQDTCTHIENICRYSAFNKQTHIHTHKLYIEDTQLPEHIVQLMWVDIRWVRSVGTAYQT